MQALAEALIARMFATVKTLVVDVTSLNMTEVIRLHSDFSGYVFYPGRAWERWWEYAAHAAELVSK